MIATLQFDLSDADDMHRYMRCVHADDCVDFIWEFQNHLRAMSKHSDVREVNVDRVYEEFLEMRDAGVVDAIEHWV